VGYQLWESPDGSEWHRLAVPLSPGTAGDHTLSVAADGTDVLLVADDGTGGRVWTGGLPDD
jgi:hypothetical protein